MSRALVLVSALVGLSLVRRCKRRRRKIADASIADTDSDGATETTQEVTSGHEKETARETAWMTALVVVMVAVVWMGGLIWYEGGRRSFAEFMPALMASLTVTLSSLFVYTVSSQFRI